jgi:ABC-type cobalamin/Fe3+-siderophores transport system ATPase subunit
MQLTLKTPHQSITSFQADELPNFTVITGPNGSGKTHLLRSIENGSILIDGQAKNTGAQARFFDATSIVPTSTGMFSSQTLRTFRTNAVGQLTNFQANLRAQMNQHLQGILNNVRQADPSFNLLDPFDLLDPNFAINSQLNDERAQNYNQLLEYAKRFVVSHTSAQHLRNSGISQGLEKFAAERSIPITRLSIHDLETAAIDIWGGVNIFQQNLGQLFVAYRDMQLVNKLKKSEKNETGRTDIKTFTDQEFIENYGQSPWDFVNEILLRAKLPFSINAPDSYSYEDFMPQLTKTISGVKIPFESLSSGEKVLMSFALCLYQARDGRQAIEYPEILLLDEIDAPLHPSMVKDLIATIEEVLVGQKKIKVILTTHSPTTVAIAPEGSVFVMRDSSTLKKTSKENALRLLTYGVPTLSISFDARRQVFVESRYDMSYYEKLYALLRSQIESEKSLVFIAASGAKPNEVVIAENGGASVVRKLINQLSDAGNTSVYGLIDWDTTSTSTDRVKVLAENKRYSLDTCLIDPCLLALLIIRENAPEARKLELITEGESYLQLLQADKNRMQHLVDALAKKLTYSGEKIECQYVGGEKIMLFKEFLHANGHNQTNNIFDKIYFLRTSYKSEDALKSEIVTNILPDSIAWLPIEIKNAFEVLSAD